MLPINILLIDDHELFRSGLNMLLCSGIKNALVLEAESLEEAIRSTVEIPAILLLDIHLQGLNGVEGIALLKRKWPFVAIIVLSSESSQETVQLALQRGAAAFVSKSETAATILAVVQNVLRKDPIARSLARIGGNGLSQLHLTRRQCEVLDLLSQGLSNKLIGQRLSLAENTVRGHVQALLGILQVTSRSAAVFEARRSGLVG